jgi:hypothetical protein
MKKVGIVLFAVALTAGLVAANIFSFGRTSTKLVNFSFDFGKTHGSGVAASDTRGLTDFRSVDVGGVFKVEITAQKDFSVEVEADDNILPLIKTEVRNGTLHIDTDSKVSPKSQMIVRISAPDIESLDLSGVAKVSLAGVSNQALSIDTSGATEITVNGDTAKLTVDMSGASKLFASELNVDDATIETSGASRAEVNVSGVLTADASGASKVEYSGSPTEINADRSGVAHISKK